MSNMDDSRIKDVSSLLRAFFDEDHVNRGGQYATFFGCWKSVAGDQAAAHSRIVEIEKGILVVEADHPGWIHLLQFKQTEHLRAIQRRFPELDLRGISFRLSRREETATASPISPKLGPFGPGGQEQARDQGILPAQASSAVEFRQGNGPLSLDEIDDPILKERLADLKKAIEGLEKSE